MSKTIKYPKVIIAGRTNVGKSTLFNRLSKDTRAIVLHEEGVTRDYVSELISWDNKKFELVDTGGISLKKQRNITDPILEQVRDKVLDMLSKAAIILFVCDVKNGLVEEDQQIAKILHRTKKPVLLLLNKSDNESAYQANYPEFYRLGFKNILPISATHGTGMVDLLEIVTKHTNIQAAEELEKKPEYKVTILGKPNVGKSSLMNVLTRKDRSIVTEIAGTTREAISETIYSSQDIIKITDTAGVRRKSRVDQDLENLMVKSSLEAVRTSDIVIIMIDASTKQLSDQELKLLFYAYEQKKSILILFNKTDLLSEYDRESFEYELKKYDYFLKKIPKVWISCKDKKNIGKIILQLEKAWQRRKQEFNSTQVNEIVQEEWQKKPMYHKRNPLKLFKIRNVKARIPTFVLHVNYPEWFKEPQLGFIENILRKNYDLTGCPIQFVTKKV